MNTTKGKNLEIPSQIRVPHVFQVFPGVTNYLLLNMDVSLYNIHSSVDNEGIWLILEIYLSKKNESESDPMLRSDIFNG